LPALESGLYLARFSGVSGTGPLVVVDTVADEGVALDVAESAEVVWSVIPVELEAASELGALTAGALVLESAGAAASADGSAGNSMVSFFHCHFVE